MPIYGYACKNCDHTMDALQKMSDDVLVDCPQCGQPELKKLLSAPRFRLKGKGWYETDFKKDNQRNLSKGDGAAEAKTDTKTKSDKSSESKTKKDSGSSSTTKKSSSSEKTDK